MMILSGRLRLLPLLFVGAAGPFPARTLAQTITPSPSVANTDTPTEGGYYYDYAGTDAPTPFDMRCNRTAYEKFYDKVFDKETSTIGDADEGIKLTGAYYEPWFWGIKTTSFDSAYALTNGMVMDQAHKRCQKGLNQLTKDLAGRQGPMKSWFYYQAMCTAFCLDSDAFHQAALSESGCLCTELSVTDDDEADDDRVDALWCRRNSARMLCEIHGVCGVWECPVEDFMCPRYEYNRVFVDFAGGGKMGDCLTSGAVQLEVPWALTALTALTTAVFSVRAFAL